jgi:hypothetical protein
MPFPTVQNHTSVGGLQTSISESSSPVFPENEFSLDFLFLLVVCSSEQRISPWPISAILERVSPDRCKNADLAGAVDQG